MIMLHMSSTSEKGVDISAANIQVCTLSFDEHMLYRQKPGCGEWDGYFVGARHPLGHLYWNIIVVYY